MRFKMMVREAIGIIHQLCFKLDNSIDYPAIDTAPIMMRIGVIEASGPNDRIGTLPY
jgi:hypothetical protein